MSNMSSSEAATVERSWPRGWAVDELALQREFLQFLRATAVNKVAGLEPAMARATPLETSPTMSLLGVIKHLTAVERFWISIVAGGRDLPMLWEPDDVHAEWRLTDRDSPASVVAAYQTEWVHSAEALADLPADAETRKLIGGERRTVRWIMAHVVQETARHVGHLDVLREMADGKVGE
jgi:uncharacterized damage-inducible protein DinB